MSQADHERAIGALLRLLGAFLDAQETMLDLAHRTHGADRAAFQATSNELFQCSAAVRQRSETHLAIAKEADRG